MIRAAVRGLGELLITFGLVLLLFVTWQLWWTDIVAGAEQQQIASELREGWADDRPEPVQAGSTPEPTQVPVPSTAEPPAVAAPGPGAAFALVHIPRFGADFARPVIEGTTLDLLRKGVGHYTDTALPGAVGNFAVAGHRTTYGKPFNQIADLVPGDAVVVETKEAWFTYRVRSSTIVTPDRVDVIAPVPEQVSAVPTERLLTMTSCHPMYSAQQRYIVYAVLESWQPATDGPPTSLAVG